MGESKRKKSRKNRCFAKQEEVIIYTNLIFDNSIVCYEISIEFNIIEINIIPLHREGLG